MTPSPASPASHRPRARAAFLGLAAGARAAERAEVVPFARVLAEGLLAPAPDLQRVVEGWRGWATGREAALEPALRAAMAHYARVAAPPDGPLLDTPAGLPAHLVPVALLTFDQPRNLVGGTYHLAVLTHPEAEAAWGAVAVNVMLARFLPGYRDFVPDVLEMLRNNEAPASLREAVGRVPLLRGAGELLDAAATAAPAPAELLVLAHLAYHEPQPARGLAWLRESPWARLAPLATALLGARDGDAAASTWSGLGAAERAELTALADRLARVDAP